MVRVPTVNFENRNDRDWVLIAVMRNSGIGLRRFLRGAIPTEFHDTGSGTARFGHAWMLKKLFNNQKYNPGLLKMAVERYLGLELYERITRTGLYNEKMEPFA